MKQQIPNREATHQDLVVKPLHRERLDDDDAVVEGMVMMPPKRGMPALIEADAARPMLERQQLMSRASLLNTAADPVALGREAWLRIKDAAPKNWDNWKALGEALLIGRQEAMARANGRTSGKTYSRAFYDWLQLQGLGDIDKSDRAKLIQIMDNLEEVEALRATWSEGERAKRNCPSAIWQPWKGPRRRLLRERELGKAAPGGNIGQLSAGPAQANVAGHEGANAHRWFQAVVERARQVLSDATISDPDAKIDPKRRRALGKVIERKLLPTLRKAGEDLIRLTDFLEEVANEADEPERPEAEREQLEAEGVR